MNVGQDELAPALDIDLVRTIDQDVGNGRILQHGLERTVTNHVVDDVLGDLLLLLLVEQEPSLVGELDHELHHASLQVCCAHADRQRRIDAAQDLFVNQRGRGGRGDAGIAKRRRRGDGRGLSRGVGRL